MAIQAQVYSESFGFPLGGSQDWTENACGFNEFYFNLQQQQQFIQNQQQLQNLLPFDNNVLLPKNNFNNHPSMDSSQSLAAEFEKQMQEIGQFISLQNERLRLALLEQRKQQIGSLLRKYESKTQILLRQKDGEIAKAVNRTMELENFLRKMEIENQAWQRVAKEKEAMVMSLNNTIEQVRESVCLSANGVEDAESCCEETGENRGHEVEQEQRRTGQMICKSCNSRNSCCIFLPCRHLCSCQACEPFLDSCPVCNMVKKSSIEALI